MLEGIGEKKENIRDRSIRKEDKGEGRGKGDQIEFGFWQLCEAR
jgi:hypothetical protein